MIVYVELDGDIQLTPACGICHQVGLGIQAKGWKILHAASLHANINYLASVFSADRHACQL